MTGAPAKKPTLAAYLCPPGAEEAALRALLRKCLAGGSRALVRAPAQSVPALSRALWTAERDALLPHGLAGGAREARQPILLSGDDGPLPLPPPNGAAALALHMLPEEAPPPAPSPFARVLCVWQEAAEPPGPALARAAALGYEVSAWTRGAEGGWRRAGGGG